MNDNYMISASPPPQPPPSAAAAANDDPDEDRIIHLSHIRVQIREEVILIPNPRGPLLKPDSVKIRMSAIIANTMRVVVCVMMRATAMLQHLLMMHSLPKRTRTAYLCSRSASKSSGQQAEAQVSKQKLRSASRSSCRRVSAAAECSSCNEPRG